MRKFIFIFVSFFTFSFGLLAQDKSETRYEMYGFVRTDFFADSRKMYNSVQDLFSFYPMYSVPGANGEDLNDVSSAGLSSITTRLGFNFYAPGLFKSKSKSVIEIDFGGAPNYWLLRLRQAFTQLSWKNSDLLVGQTWHPLFTRSMMPNMLSLNTGAPFQPFNRSPQIQYNNYLGKLKLTGAMVYQMMYTSSGPEGSSYYYQRNAIMPELFVSAEVNNSGLQLGVAVDYKSIMPERYITNNLGETAINKNLLSTPAGMIYGSYSKNLLAIKAKAIYGQNLTEHAVIGGYAITPEHDYIPFNTLTSFINVCYGKKHVAGLFAGYTSNLGPDKDLPANSKFYGFGVDKANTANEMIVSDIYRITPTYSYNLKNWKVGVELEYTNAWWGRRSSVNGSIDKTESTENYRVAALMMYSF